MDPIPTYDETNAAIFALHESCEKYMLIPGQIENRVMILDTLDLSIWSFPYSLIRGILSGIFS